MPKYELDSTWYEYPNEGVNNDKKNKHQRNTAFIPKSIVKLRIKGSSKSIPASAFSDQPKLTYLELQEGVETVGDYAFYKCPYLFEVHCPLSLRQLGVYAFAQATLLTEVTLPSDGSLSIIPASAFEYCESLLYLKLPASIQSLHHFAFFHCTSLQVVQFETKTSSNRILGLAEIHDSAFGSCTSLTKVKLPVTLVKLYSNAFADCTRLEDIKMAEGLQTIERRAFSGCTSLKYLEIPSTVEDFLLDDVKVGCSSRLKVRQRSPGDVLVGIGSIDKDLYSSDQDFYQAARRKMNEDKCCINLCSIM